MGIAVGVRDLFFVQPTFPDEPDTVHLEVRVAGRLDIEQLRDAIVTAAERHPLARAGLRPWHAGTIRHRWEIAERIDAIPLAVRDCVSDDEVARFRGELLDRAPSLDLPPAFVVGVAHRSGGDHLILSLHHAVYDGIGAFRILLSILRAYAGQPDPVPEIDAITSYEQHSTLPERTLAQRIRLVRQVRRYQRAAVPAVAVAPEGGSAPEHYGAITIPFDAAETRAIIARRRKPGTVNDLLLAAFITTIRDWNAEHGADVGPVAVDMPVNTRPPQWRNDILGNFTGAISVRITNEIPQDLNAVSASITEQTQQAKESGSPDNVREFLWPVAILPTALKTRWRRRITAHPSTAGLSNLGVISVISDPPVTGLWFSPPTCATSGMAMGAVTLDDTLFACIRFRHSTFSDSAMSAFAKRFRQVLLD